MISRLLILFFMLFFCSLIKVEAQPNSEENDLDKRFLFGKVKTLVTHRYVFKEEGQVIILHDSAWFNGEGNVILETTRNARGILEYLTIYSYDSVGGNCLSERSFEGPNKKKVDEIYSSYNENRKLVIEKSIDWQDSTADRIRYYYDSKGRCIKRMAEYSELLSPVQYEPYFQNKRLYKYDSLNRIIKAELIEKNGKISHTTEYTYDKSGYSYKTKFRLGDSSITRCNNTGRIINYKKYRRKNLENSVTYRWDKFGRMKSYKAVKADGTVTNDLKIVYSKFDENKNWKEKIIYLDGKPTQYIEQEIFYY
jgi:hypothetical protein